MRVASIFLPDLAVERISRQERKRAQPELRAAAPLPADDDPGVCSVPRGGNWRPGARWARAPEPARPARKKLFSNRPPLVLAEIVGQRELISAACPVARALGLLPGMSVAHARALVSTLDVRPAEREADAAFLHRLLVHAASCWEPNVTISGNDGIWLEISRSAHLFGGEEAFCRKVVAFLRRLGFTAKLAVADTGGAAHAVARFGADRITIVPRGGNIDAIAPLPVEALRLRPEAVDAARKFGLEQIVDLFRLPRAPLVRRLGRDTISRIDQAVGREPEPIPLMIVEGAPAAELRLLEPISTPEAIEQVIGDVIDGLVAILRDRGLGARALMLSLARVDSTAQQIPIGTSLATRDPDHLRRLFRRKLEIIEPRFGIEAIRLTAAVTEPLGAVALGGALAGETRPADIAPLVDQVAARLGEQAIFKIGAIESDVPERALRRAEPLETVAGWPKWRRPARLLRPPEEVSNIASLLPDGAPRRFRWRGEMHEVIGADGPERIHGEWWVRAGEMWAVRDYFHVEDRRGGHYWLFRRGDGLDPATGNLSWFVHGVG